MLASLVAARVLGTAPVAEDGGVVGVGVSVLVLEEGQEQRQRLDDQVSHPMRVELDFSLEETGLNLQTFLVIRFSFI